MNMLTKVVGAFMLLLLLVLYGLVGNMDRDDAVREQQHYCAMVAAYMHDHTVGWPDYRHSYKRECLHK